MRPVVSAFHHQPTGSWTYVVMDPATHAAAVIDPLRHTAVYHDAIAAAGASLAVVLDTHVHADHISGGPALTAATGAAYHVHAYDAIHLHHHKQDAAR